MIEFGIMLLCMALTAWTTTALVFRIRTKVKDGICGCHHNISYHLSPDERKTSRCNFIGGYDKKCGCQRFVPMCNPTSAMIEAGERELGR